MKARILLVLAIALVLVVASSALTVAAAAGAVVPFKAHYQTYPEPVGSPTNGILTLAIPGEGQATHLGRSTWYADMQVDLSQVPNVQTGTMVFTAANGDQLFGTFAGNSTPPTGPVEFWGDFEITEGTGRFEGVTCTGTYSGTAESAEGMLYFDGKLTK